MKAVVIYDTVTHTTEKAAGFIAEGLESIEGIEVKCINVSDADHQDNVEYIEQSQLVIIGSPTRLTTISAKMKTWFEDNYNKLHLKGKLGGAFSTGWFIHGGADKVVQEILALMLTMGMMVYSGGAACGMPMIPLGPTGTGQNIDNFKELFVTYGKRMGEQGLKLI